LLNTGAAPDVPDLEFSGLVRRGSALAQVSAGSLVTALEAKLF
jgi:hypothetical protein